jgi:hypothetical protein
MPSASDLLVLPRPERIQDVALPAEGNGHPSPADWRDEVICFLRLTACRTLISTPAGQVSPGSPPGHPRGAGPRNVTRLSFRDCRRRPDGVK